MAELLLEILSEEIPARMQARAAEDLTRLVVDGLVAGGLPTPKTQTFVTPRRLVLVLEDLPLATAAVAEEKRGPRVGAPEQAMAGFLKSTGLSLDQLEQRDTGKGVFWFATQTSEGRQTADLAKEVIEQAMATFPWPKSQRWGDYAVRWVRPITSILCLLDGAVIPVTFGPVTAGDSTIGHRFLAPGRFRVRDFAEYQERMSHAFVMLDAAERRKIIMEQAEALAKQHGLVLHQDDGLLNEVTGLVEWPTVLMGRIDDRFMEVPKEVLMTSMRTHQKYFSLLKADGSLAPAFLVVSNMVTSDQGAAIVAGNEKVLRARLSDAAFFWDTDRKTNLEDRLPKLAQRLFFAPLGTMADKAQRMRELARYLVFYLPGVNVEDAERAALLAKADLSTDMVGEFPELQGLMGSYYARENGEKPEVACAIAEHYAPQGPSDTTPTALLSVCVALADKLDSLVGFFGVNERPTGSKDPFALRRAAISVIRLIMDNQLRLPLFAVLQLAAARYPTGVLLHDPKALSNDLLEFFADRLKVHLKEQGVRFDLLNAIFALGDEDDILRLLIRVEALKTFLGGDDGSNLLIAFRRAVNIVRIEEKKDETTYSGSVDPTLLRQDEEIALHKALEHVRTATMLALKSEDFTRAMEILASLRQPMDAFFEAVTVNDGDPDVRINRLHLLSQVREVMAEIADFSQVEGQDLA